MEKEKITTKKYNSPVEFMKDYTELFEEQLRTPKKIMLKEIEYFNEFEEALLNYTIKISSKDKLDIEFYEEIENILDTIRSKTYYDLDFYELSVLQYIKGIAFLLDRLDTEVKEGNFDNVELLYYFCDLNIDLTESLAAFIEKDLINLENLKKIKWAQYQKLLNRINLKLQEDKTFIITSNNELKKRYSPSDELLGQSRIRNYLLSDCIKIIVKRSKKTNEEKYFFITTLISEFLTEDIGSEEDIAALKEYSNQMLL
ncbi:hypothetical protein NBO_7g0059 [Nosema bombycis CQ1]|uniref:Uncharacterized protein n=1 Tax=Nosema bombycis (strain CQ1 / CVCC 102059) TaxID=578461 RepID=R0MQR8_NOSB1|nr:hypothetical protein NBO_7g0059 [Nosema bombycis CQ1]|eukprot:EOB15238.1 hypothetical protein NBO_7g0059 [Nosema bombycis CQ1]